MLQIESNYDFRKRMLSLHEKDIRNSNAKLREDEFELTDANAFV